MKKYLFLIISIVLFFACEDKQEKDCAGVEGGTAALDNCDDCVGGNTGVEACTEDCNGDFGGTAQTEDCTITDIDSNIYQNVQIGSQLWMAENLRVTHYNNGDEIPNGSEYSNSEWVNLLTGAYAIYDSAQSNAEIYGNLYNWYAVNDDRGICPESWHIPTDDEIKQLERYLGMSEEEVNSDEHYRGTDEGSKLAGNSDLWNDGNLKNNSEFGASGFNALPAGYREGNYGWYYSMGDYAYFWSSTEDSSNDAWERGIGRGSLKIHRNNRDKGSGYSVRCIRD